MKDKNKNGTSARFNAPPQAYAQQGAQPYAQQQFAQPQQSAQPYRQPVAPTVPADETNGEQN